MYDSEIVTVGVYLSLSLAWAFVFFYTMVQLLKSTVTHSLLKKFFVVLHVLAFKNLFESLYFGAYFGSMYHYLPVEIFKFLEQPYFLLVPKLLNLLTVLLIVYFIFRGWLSYRAQSLQHTLDHHQNLLEENSFLKTRTVAQEDLIELFTIVSHIRQQLQKAHNADEILSLLIKQLAHYSHFKVIWIGTQQAGNDYLSVDYQIDKCSPSYLDENFHVSLNEKDPLSHGPTAQALLQNKTQIIEDTQRDYNFKPWRSRAKFSGIRSVVSIPFSAQQQSRPSQVISFYISDEHLFTYEEIRILEDLIQNISSSIHLIESETARAINEAELLETSNLLQSIISNIPVRIFWKDRSLRYLGCNELFARDAHLSDPSQIIGKKDTELIWKKDAAIYNQDDRDVILNNKTITNRIEPQGKNWLLTNKAPLKDASGELIGVIGSYIDITYQHKAESYIKENEQRFKTLIDALPNIAIQGYDKERRVFYWNQESERLYGYSKEEAMGQKLENLIIPEAMRVGVLAAIDAWVHHNEAIGPAELELQRKDGSLVPVFSSHVLLNRLEENPELYCFDQDLSQQKEAEKILEYRANYDALTKLPNRHFLFKYLNSLINKATRQNSRFALLFLDLDDSKKINDTYGHQYGDALLQEVSKRLHSILRDYDFIARYGGDEFVITLEFNQDLERSAKIAQKVIEVLSTPYTILGKKLLIGVSVGIAVYPTHASNVDQLLNCADSAMYVAKEQGKNNYQYYKT